MVDLKSRLPPRGTLIRIAAISVIVIGVLVTLIAIYVYSQAVGRFEVRRVSLPTRIFTDMFPLALGATVTPEALVDKLQRLGYRERKTPELPGDYVAGSGRVDVHLRPFKYQTQEHEARIVHVGLRKGVISSVTSPVDGGAIEGAALEPELLTSILSEQLENRRPVTIDQVPKHVTDAVIVTEDVRFWQHPGVDPLGILRAFFRNVKARGVAEGGSTLTQQLVKNYYLTNERTMRRKVVEAFMSVILDAKYSKKEILEAYLNDVYLGRDRSISILGIGEASRFYFGKPMSEISIAEAALLAGMIRGPNNYSPFTNPSRARQRRDTVLNAMLRHRRISREEYEAAVKTVLPKKPYREKSGLASIPYYVDRVLDEMARDYGIEDVKGRGLSIYTAIDLEWQDTAARRLEGGLQALEKARPSLRRANSPLQGVIMAADVQSGELRALVGGRNYQRSQFNRALKAQRQAGSLFKPFVYLAAFEPSLSQQNITPATLVNDTRFVLERRYGKDWSPRNYEERYHGVVTVRSALEQSLNVASVRIGLSTGLGAIIKTAHSLGIESELDEVPSLILGSIAVTPVEMAQSYLTMARMGSRVPLRTIRFVTDDRGNMVANGEDVQPVQVFPARDVFLTVHLMKGVVDRGTAASSRSYGFRKAAAGKTGTTNDKRDAWFIGFTPTTLALSWVGFDDNTPIGVSGSDGAVPLWARFMKDITATDRDAAFPVPARISFVEIDSLSGGLPVPQCPPAALVMEAFKDGTAPLALCALHQPPLPPVVDPYALPPLETSYPPTATDMPPQLEGGGYKTETLGGPALPPITPSSPPPVSPPSPPVLREPPQAPILQQPPPTQTQPPQEQPPQEQPPGS